MSKKQAETLDKVQEITNEIKSKDLTSLRQVWEIGKLLNEVKGLLPRGDWSPWLQESFGWSNSYAARLVKLYGEYPNGPEAEGVGVSILLVTLSLDQAVRSKLNEICSKAELTVAEAKQLIQSLEQDKSKLAAQVEELRAKVKTSPEEREKLKADLRAEIAKEQAADRKKAERAAKEQAEELAELNRINSQLQADQEKQADTVRELREALVESRRQAKQAESLNRELIDARKEAARLSDELDALRAQSQASLPLVAQAEAIVKTQDSPETLAELKQLRELVSGLRSSAHGQAVKLESVLRARRLLREYCLKLIGFINESGLVAPVSSDEIEAASQVSEVQA